MVLSSARTEACACDSEHGADDEHSVPLPVGDTNNVLIVAACDTDGTATTNPRAVTTAPNAARTIRLYRWPARVSDIVVCTCFQEG